MLQLPRVIIMLIFKNTIENYYAITMTCRDFRTIIKRLKFDNDCFKCNNKYLQWVHEGYIGNKKNNDYHQLGTIIRNANLIIKEITTPRVALYIFRYSHCENYKKIRKIIMPCQLTDKDMKRLVKFELLLSGSLRSLLLDTIAGDFLELFKYLLANHTEFVLDNYTVLNNRIARHCNLVKLPYNYANYTIYGINLDCTYYTYNVVGALYLAIFNHQFTTCQRILEQFVINKMSIKNYLDKTMIKILKSEPRFKRFDLDFTENREPTFVYCCVNNDIIGVRELLLQNFATLNQEFVQFLKRNVHRAHILDNKLIIHCTLEKWPHERERLMLQFIYGQLIITKSIIPQLISTCNYYVFEKLKIKNIIIKRSTSIMSLNDYFAHGQLIIVETPTNRDIYRFEKPFNGYYIAM